MIRAVSANGAVIEGMDYGAFGERRGYIDPTLPAAVPQTTTRGFTGHEMVDDTDVIHMSGRIYDSALGRFPQADPVIQEPNNLLSPAVPSGFSFLGKTSTRRWLSCSSRMFGSENSWASPSVCSSVCQ